MHTQPGVADLRKVLQLREDWVRGQASSHQQPAEEVEEEGEEEKQVRLRACMCMLPSIPGLPHAKQYMFEAGARNVKIVHA